MRARNSAEQIILLRPLQHASPAWWEPGGPNRTRLAAECSGPCGPPCGRLARARRVGVQRRPVASHLAILDGWGARTTNEAPPMTTTSPSRTRVALRLLSAAFLVTALLASGGTASAARKKTKTPAPEADQAQTPAQPAAAAPAQENSRSRRGCGARSGRASASAGTRSPSPAAAGPSRDARPGPCFPPRPSPKPAPPAQHKRSEKITELGLSPQTTTYALTIQEPHP